MARLLLPISWPSSFSVFNLAAAIPRQNPWPSGGPNPATTPSANPVKGIAADRDLGPDEETNPAASWHNTATAQAGGVMATKSGTTAPWSTIGIIFWLAGVAAFGAMVARAGRRVARRYASGQIVTDPAVLNLLDDCRLRMGIRVPVRLMVCLQAGTPALFGLRRPQLLLPPGVVETFSRRELELVFMHELAHINRRDLWLNWLVAVLQAIHWFNPLLWLGFARWRADRELACDALVLEMAGPEGSTDYGRTIYRLELTVFAREAQTEGGRKKGSHVRAESEIEVPRARAEEVDSPIDIGTLELEPANYRVH